MLYDREESEKGEGRRIKIRIRIRAISHAIQPRVILPTSFIRRSVNPTDSTVLIVDQFSLLRNDDEGIFRFNRQGLSRLRSRQLFQRVSTMLVECVQGMVK